MVQILKDYGGFPAMVRCLVAVAGTLLLFESAALAQANYKKLFTFGEPDLTTSANPVGPLIQGSDGALYGTTTSLSYNGGSPAVVFRIKPDGSGYQVLHRFGTVPGDGAPPVFGVIEGSDGYLYGASDLGGDLGIGTIFRLSKDGKEYTVLRSFQGPSNGDGREPQTGVLEGRDGRLYGTTLQGGTGFLGTLFTLNKDGSGYAVLWNFSRPATSPQFPLGIIHGSDGVLYGVTGGGGGSGVGTVFKVNTDGTLFSVIHEFDLNADPYPTERLVEGSDGFLFGVTQHGVVFKLSKDGSSYSILKSLSESPHLLVEGDDGMLYGVTTYDGTKMHGSVFKIKRDGSRFTEIYSFSGEDGDGALPNGGLLKGRDGAFFGTTMFGGKRGPNGELLYSYGTVFVFRPGLRVGVQLSPGGSILLSSEGVPDTPYTFQSVTNISSTNWTAIGTRIADTNGLMVIDLVLGTNRTRFFRVSQP